MKQTDQENEITAATEHYARMLVLAKEFGMSDEEVAERKRIAIKAINDKYNAEEVKGVEETEAKKIQLKHNQVQQALQIAQSMASFLLTLNNTSDKKDEAQQKKAFKRGKALQLAGAAMSTASAIIASLAAPPVGLGVPAGIPGAIIAGLSGAAQAITISRQKFNSPSSASTGGAASVGSLSMSAPEMTEALVPTSFADSATAPTTGSSAGIAPVQAFVVSSSITNQQQLDATISHQSSL